MDKGKRYFVLRPAHGFYGGGVIETDIISTIDAGVAKWHTLIIEMNTKVIGELNIPGRLESANRVYDPNYTSPTLNTMTGGGEENLK